jgi:CheY-like chemotaxis protein
MEALFRQKFRREVRAGVLEFIFAFSGEDALALLREQQHADIVLILSDINMPGMSGLELLAALRREQLGKRVFMVTAYGDTATREKAMSLGADDFITKPVDFADLRQRLGLA